MKKPVLQGCVCRKGLKPESPSQDDFCVFHTGLATLAPWLNITEAGATYATFQVGSELERSFYVFFFGILVAFFVISMLGLRFTMLAVPPQSMHIYVRYSDAIF